MSKEWLQSLVGDWEGECRTWFEPGKLADESKIRGTFRSILDESFVRHEYESSMHGEARTGEETIAFDTIANKFQISWFDSFHMSYALMFSDGDGTATGFVVHGRYSAPNSPPWGWKTVYELTSSNSLTITAYNVTPDGQEARAVEIIYTRRQQ